MESRVSITESEILHALREAMQEQDSGVSDAFTVAELCETTQRGEKTVRKMLRSLIQSGRAEVVQKPTVDLTGKTIRVPAYRAL